MFQLSGFQRTAFEIGYTRPAGGFLHEFLRHGKRRLEDKAKLSVDSVPVVIGDYEAKAQAPAKQEQANRPQNRPDQYDHRALVEQILLLEYHITDSQERKRLSQNLALCLLLLSD